MATISSVLYCNMSHPELKTEYPNWNDRWKQISKRWRLLSNEEKQPFLQQARDNRSASKMKKTQQVFIVRTRAGGFFLFLLLLFVIKFFLFPFRSSNFSVLFPPPTGTCYISNQTTMSSGFFVGNRFCFFCCCCKVKESIRELR